MSSGPAAHRPAARTLTRALRAAAVSAIESLETRRLFATFNVQDDAFVRDGNFADTNFGAADTLFTQNAPDQTREAYLKFDLSSAGTVGTAILRVDAQTQSASTDDTRIAVYAVSDTTWVEGNGNTSNASGDGSDTDNTPAGEITFGNKPDSAGAPLDIITISGDQEQGYALDVTNYVNAEKAAGRTTVSFVLRSFDQGTDYIRYVSGEGGQFGPRLDVTSDAGPAATANPVADITTFGGTSTDVTVTYTDPDKVEFLSISPDDLLVLGPDGQPLDITSATPNGSASATTLQVTYTVAAPGGSWDDADAGAYSVRLASGQITDSLENTAPPGELTTFNVGNIDPPPGQGPTATFTSGGGVTSGAATYSFTVTYADTDNVSRASIDPSDLTVAGPGGDLTVTDVSVEPDANGTSLVATYTVGAPGGGWDAADDGTYTVSLLDSAVFDVGDNAAAAAQLGTFAVNLGGGGGNGGGTRQLVGSFGSGTPNPKGITFTDADGTLTRISLKVGQGQLFSDSGAYGIVMVGTTGASALSIKTKGGDGRVKITDSSAAGPMKSVTGKTADLVGLFSFGGPASKITLGNVVGARMLMASGGSVAMTLGDVTNFSIQCDSAIKSIKANVWADDDGNPDVIQTSDFGTLTVKGNFAADIESAANVKSVKAGGALTGSTINAAGGIGKVTAATMTSSRIFAGGVSNPATMPQALSDFANAAGSIAGVTLKGLFSDAIIAAPTIGKLALGTVQTSNNGTPFGVVADRLASLTATNPVLGPLRLSKLDDPSGSTTAGDFVLRVL